MNAKDWLILKALYEENSITKAAEKLYISQPALSYRIKELESDLGVTILIRSNRGVKFTPEGEYLVNYSVNMLNELRNVKDYVQSLSSAEKGIIRLGVASNFARHALPKILRDFSKQYQDVQYNLYTGLTKTIQRMLNNDEIYVGIIRGPTEWDDYKIKLTEEKICIISKQPVDLQRLPLLPMISYKTSQSLQDTIDKWWQENFNVPPNITMNLDNIETSLQLVLEGLGYAIVPSIGLDSIDDDLYIYPLTDKKGKNIVRETHLIFKEDSLKFPIIQIFIKFVKNYFK